MSGFIPYFIAIALFITCNLKKTIKDTRSEFIILGRSDTALIVKNRPIYLEIKLSTKGIKEYRSDKKCMILFQSPKLILPPDGVYEIFVNNDAWMIPDLNSSHPSFVGLLDLYTFSEPNTKNILVFDISAIFEKLHQSNDLDSIFIAIKFQGNILPDKSESKHAGELRIDWISVVQPKA